MSWFDGLLTFVGRRPPVLIVDAPIERAPASTPTTRATTGGRVSLPAGVSTFGGFGTVVLAPTNAEEYWRTNTLDTATLTNVNGDKLTQLLADLSPDVSRALWDFLRLCNPGWEILAIRPGSADEAPDSRGQAAIDAYLDTLRDLYGSVDVVIGRLFLAAFLRGALFAELVLDASGRLPVDLATPDPAAARFRRVDDPVRGVVWQLGQYQKGKWVDLDSPTIRYLPIDPFPDSPYGRAPVSPAVFSTLFLLGLLHDLRRVVSQQGYPRLDVTVDLEQIKAAMPAGQAVDPATVQTWANEAITQVQAVFSSLKPDDTYVHSNAVTVNRPVGTVDAASLGAIDPLIQALERLSVRALKTMPFMMAVSESTTETQANRQYEQLIQGIKAIQHYAESMMESLLELGLRAQGIQSSVLVRFSENRASEMMRDAQTEALRIANAREKVAAGWIDNDEAAMEVVGHVAVAEPVAPPEPSEDAEDAEDVEPEPGSNRAVHANGHRAGVRVPA